MEDSMSYSLMQSTLMKTAVTTISNHLSNLKSNSSLLEKLLCFLFMNNAQNLSVKELFNQTFAVDSNQSMGELYVSQTNSDLVKRLELVVIRSLDQLESTKRESVCYKKASTNDPVDKQLSHIRSFLEISRKRKHLFNLSSELQNLKRVQLQKCNVSRDDLKAELQLLMLQSKVHYMKHRIGELKLDVESSETYISEYESLRTEMANIESLLGKKRETIRHLHEENGKLLNNLPLLCRETKQIKQQLSGQIIDTHKVAHELTSNNLLQDFDERIQDISFNRRTFSGGNTYVDILYTDSLYINCCNLYSLEPNLKIPDILLKCILTQIQKSWLAENSLKLLHYLLMNLNKGIHTSEKLRNYDVTFRAEELKHLLSCVTNLKELSKEIKQHISFCSEFISDWRQIPIRRMLL
uniref:LisH domain-containing protein n=1 Tax=Schistosoma mansoni TaxID=6183 RepID=A0A5K4FGF4_SCHMA